MYDFNFLTCDDIARLFAGAAVLDATGGIINATTITEAAASVRISWQEIQVRSHGGGIIANNSAG